ncbi:AAA family ATPase [Streptomyces sp. YS-B37]|uniref:AAA family ATPase n=1 Tax=Streptomyces sp. YS-B37 TaxID=3407669 RepID=UPI003B505653
MDESEDGEFDAPFIYDQLAVGVVGQETGKRDLATLLAMHVRSLVEGDINLAHTAPNALIIGPTGVGKTHAIRTAAAALRLPLAIADATRLATSAFGDESLDDVLIELLRASRRQVTEKGEVPELEELKDARRGIVFIDEFDKLATDLDGRDGRNEIVQRRLLQFIDGAAVTLPPGMHIGDDEMVFDTAGVLFIVAGAFTDLLAGLGGRPHEVMRGMARHDHVISQDLVRYGFMPELIARLPVIIEFSPLSEDDLVGILQNKQTDPSQFYVNYMRSMGTELIIKADAQHWIAAAAARLKVGARGLHQVLFPMLSLVSQELENENPRPERFIVDKQAAEDLTRRVEYRRSGHTADQT